MAGTLKYGSMKKGDEPAAKAAANEKRGEDKALESKAEDAGKEAEGAKIADAAGAPLADVRTRHMKARQDMRKSHEGERRDMNNRHRDERRDMYARQDKAIKAMEDAHDLELNPNGSGEIAAPAAAPAVATPGEGV